MKLALEDMGEVELPDGFGLHIYGCRGKIRQYIIDYHQQEGWSVSEKSFGAQKCTMLAHGLKSQGHAVAICMQRERSN